MITRKAFFTLLKTALKVEEIDDNRSDIELLIPSVSIMFDYDQQSVYHPYDLWMHSLHTVINLPRNMDDDMLYLAALLHDIGKPSAQCRSNRSGDTNMHYYNHQEKSSTIISDMIIPELEQNGITISDEDRKRLLYYVRFHDDRVSKKLKHVNRHMKLASWKEFQHLMLLQVADATSHIQTSFIREKIEKSAALAGEEGEVLYQRYLTETLRER